MVLSTGIHPIEATSGKWEEFSFLPNARKAIRELTESGYQIIVVTNQSGIGRGLYSEEDVADIHARMVAEIREAGGAIADVYYCPHHPEAGCACRKPKPGMLARAAREHNIELSSAYLIGDWITDIEVGAACRCHGVSCFNRTWTGELLPLHQYEPL